MRWEPGEGAVDQGRFGVRVVPDGLYLRPSSDRILVVGTAARGWSAVLANRIRGLTLVGKVRNAVRMGGMRGFYTVFRRTSGRPRMSGTWSRQERVTSLWCGQTLTRKGGYGKRYVAAQRESGSRWVFQQFGEPLDFEDTDAYLSRRIRDRLTPTMLVDYCAALGLRPFDDAFYTGPCVMLHLDNPRIVPAGLVRYPWEFQEERGWGPQAWARRAQLRVPRPESDVRRNGRG